MPESRLLFIYEALCLAYDAYTDRRIDMSVFSTDVVKPLRK